MKVNLSPNQGYLKENKRELDKEAAFKEIGIKAAVCYREGKVTPEIIRNTESKESLIKRGLKTILSDHTSPSEQISISLEIVDIPKILCMILNNEHQYCADERSLRYTLIEKSSNLSDTEIELYYKWLSTFENILKEEYLDFFLMFNKRKTPSKTMEASLSAIKKIAQENARYMTSVFIPTTLTYTVPLAQINKLALYLNNIALNPSNKFEELLVPYIKEFLTGLEKIGVLITEHDAHTLCPSLNIPDTNKLLFKNNKHIELSLFASKNKFSGLNLPNEYGPNISYNMHISLASLAQFQRHRTMNFEMLNPSVEDTNFYIPLLLEDKPELISLWLQDISLVNKYYPQGKIVSVNMNGPLKHLVNYVGKERACDRAFLETEDTFNNIILPDIYEHLKDGPYHDLADALAPYVGKLRCAYPDYNCPTPCGHPRIRRKF